MLVRGGRYWGQGSSGKNRGVGACGSKLFWNQANTQGPATRTSLESSWRDVTGASRLKSLPPTHSTTLDPSLGTNNSSKPKKQKGKIPYLESLSLSQENIFLHVKKTRPSGAKRRLQPGSQWGVCSHPSVSLAAESLIRFFFFFKQSL